MPLIKPEVQKILRAAGLEKEESSGTASEQLSQAGLSTSDIAERLTGLAESSGSDALRLRALEIALKVHGALKEQPTTQVPSFTIIIQSASESSKAPDINPIVFPRQSLNLTSNLSATQKEPIN